MFQGLCENVITIIEKFQDSLFVCGTNGHRPQCWKLVSVCKVSECLLTICSASSNSSEVLIIQSMESCGNSGTSYYTLISTLSEISTRCWVCFPSLLFRANSRDSSFVLLQFSSVNNQSSEIVESYEGTGISPFAYTQNHVSLTVGMVNIALSVSLKVSTYD